MRVEEAYFEYLAKTEGNITNDGVSTDKGRFCLRFNEKQVVYMRNLLQAKGLDDIRSVERFLILNKAIGQESHDNYTYNFPTPKNFFDIGDVRGIVSNDSCKNQEMSLFETKAENYTEALTNFYTKPSFKWRESLFSISEKQVKVFYDDFKVDKILLSYYRHPQKITTVDPDNPESPFDETKTIEWDDKDVHRIIDLCVLDSDISGNNPRTQADIIRLNN